MLKANCVREEEKAAELELRSRLFSFGEFNSDAQVIILCLYLAHDSNSFHSLCTKHWNREIKTPHKSQVDGRGRKLAWNYLVSM